MKTLVLLSGGLDSAVVLAGAIASGDTCAAIAFDYGQPHKVELAHAQHIADHYSIAITVVSIPQMVKADDVVFAGRNLVLASIAISAAQTLGYDRVAVGCNATDWHLFPDCRPPFWSALDTCAEAYGIRVSRPLIHSSKRDVVEAARRLGVPIRLTWSCYNPVTEYEHGVGDHPAPCGRCLACEVREQALAAA